MVPDYKFHQTGLLTSCTITWTERSNPQSPARLRIVPQTRQVAAKISDLNPKKPLAAPAKAIICQLKNHIPERIGPILAMTTGAIHVADISATTDTVLAIPM